MYAELHRFQLPRGKVSASQNKSPGFETSKQYKNINRGGK